MGAASRAIVSTGHSAKRTRRSVVVPITVALPEDLLLSADDEQVGFQIIDAVEDALGRVASQDDFAIRAD